MKKWILYYSKDLAVAFVIIVLLFGFAIFFTYFPGFQEQSIHAGFGADWGCITQSRGTPVCIKKPGR